MENIIITAEPTIIKKEYYKQHYAETPENLNEKDNSEKLVIKATLNKSKQLSIYESHQIHNN